MKITICAIIKDEHKFLKPWLDYHIQLGIDDFYLIEDFTSVSHKEITDMYKNVTLVNMSELKLKNNVTRQCSSYNYFLCNNPTNCDWCAFIDIDEYIKLDDNISLKELIESVDEYEGLQVWWKCYGANNITYTDRGDCDNLYSEDGPRSHPNPTWTFKSFANMKFKNHFKNCHYLTHIRNINGTRGDYRIRRNEKTYDKIWLNHYISKSWGDYVSRLKRGNITKGIRTVDWFFKMNPSMKCQKDELTKTLDINKFPTI